MKEKLLKYGKEKGYRLIPLLVSVVCILFLPMFYHEVDDRFLQDIVYSASYNKRSEYLKMIGTPLGYVLRVFTLLFPAVNWLAILYHAVITASFTVFMCFLKKMCSVKETFFVYAGILILIHLLVYMHMTFTVVAFIGVAGVLVFGLMHVKKGKGLWFLPLLFLLGCVAVSVRNRREVFCVVAFMALPMLFSVVKTKKTTAACVILMMCVLFGSLASTRTVYKWHVEKYELQENVEFHKARSAIFDTAWLTYEDIAPQMQKAGISENDLQMVYQFLLNDMSVFNTPMLQEMGKGQTVENKYNLNIADLLLKMATNPYVMGLLLIFLWLFFSMENKKRLFLGATFGNAMLLIMYLYVRQRAEARVVFPVAVIAVLFMLFFKADYDAISTGKVANKKVLCAVFAVLFLAVGVKQYVALFMETKSLTEKNEIILYAKENSDIHMTATAWTRNHLYARRIHLLTKNIEEHVIHSPFGDWFSYFPYYYARMEKIGMGDYTNNALLMLTEDEQCRFLASDQKEIPMLITYFKEHYGKDVEAVCLQSFLDGEFKLYRFYIVENNNESRKGS